MEQILATIEPFVRATKQESISDSGIVSWQTAIKRSIRTAGELARRLDLSAPSTTDQRGSRRDADFPVFVPLEFLSRMEPGNPVDPLLLQVMPTDDETVSVPGFSTDPVGEVSGAGELLPSGVLRKYRGRALLIANQACGIHCRYCFRRHFPYAAASPDRHAWEKAIAELRADSSIEEVILSGGDPLVLTDQSLETLIQAIASIPHVQRLRVHSRMPIVIPQRITERLLELLRGTRLTPWVVVHVNHAAELDQATSTALAKLIDRGIPVLNQAVLLRGVNDNLKSLEDLSRTLINLRVQPYYLHQLDRVAGAAHFEVDRIRGVELVNELRARLPGYAVPTFVQERVGEPSKTVVT